MRRLDRMTDTLLVVAQFLLSLGLAALGLTLVLALVIYLFHPAGMRCVP